MPAIEPVDKKSTKIYRVRHSLSHVMAQAVQKIRPGTLLGFGPPIDDGFYYDFIFPEDAPLTEEDLPKIAEEMKRIIGEKQEFLREDLSAEEALARLEGMQEPHKIEYARELIDKQGYDSLSFYTNGPFVDMCEGPHVEHTGQLPGDGFELHSIAGAYWRGDERRELMTRIYAYAYPNRKQLKARIKAVEQARERDHRKLGQELKIFVMDDHVGRGLPLWLPHGTVLRHELEKLAYEMEFAAGYHMVATPHVTKGGLYETSGHLPLYAESMYPAMTIDDAGEPGDTAVSEQYYLKPMNCPHHHRVFAADKRSYRDLPFRISEYGSVYRYEKSGQLQGLARVRGMTMNDAHIYVTEDQLKEEFQAVMKLHEDYYRLFNFTDYFLRLSLWDPEDPKKGDKYFDDPENWAKTEKLVRDALDEMGLDYVVSEGEAAFYGPKVDFQFRSVLEREYTVSTNQVDFAVPPRFGLAYTDRDGQERTPLCIHRAPLGTHERFISFLIEHYGGAFPTWLAPVQVRIIPVSERDDDLLAYSREVERILRGHFVRAEVDVRSETLSKKIRDASTGATGAKVPVVLVLGDRERENRSVTVRRLGSRKQTGYDLDPFVDSLLEEIRTRTHVIPE